MTKEEIITALTEVILDTLPDVGNDEVLTGSQTVTITDAAAGALSTVNPNGPNYPSTPK